MKLASLMSRVLAVRLETSRVEPGANRMPLGLIRNTWPLARMLPKMLEGLLPMTRFSTTEELLGWLNWTYSLPPTENCCQLMEARWVFWLMTTPLLPAVPMVADPATTCPPFGLARAAIGSMAPKAPAVCARARGDRACAKIPRIQPVKELPTGICLLIASPSARSQAGP